MKVDKSRVIELLGSRGDHDTAAQADKSLPDQVDTEQDRDLLDRFGVNVRDLVETVADRHGLGD